MNRQRTRPLQYVLLALNTVLLLIWNFFLWRHVFTGSLSASEVFFAVLFTLILLFAGWSWRQALAGRRPSSLIKLFDYWRRWTRDLGEAHRLTRRLPYPEKRRLGKLALSGERITDPQDAAVVEVLTRTGYLLVMPERLLKVSLAGWATLGSVYVAIKAAEGHLLTAVVAVLFFGSVLLVGLLSVSFKTRYRKTAEANGWSLE